MNKTWLYGAAALVLAATANVPANALTATGVNCKAGLTTPPADLSPSTACEGLFAGNDTNQITSSTTLFGVTGWTLADKTDEDQNGPFDFGAGDYSGTSGTWSLTGNTAGLSIFLTIKAGNDFAAYLINGAAGAWTTALSFLNRNGNAQDISHMSAYYRLDTPSEVPLPGALVLMGTVLAGGAGFGAMRKRAKKVSALQAA